jgi:hypothetical protein
MQVCQHWYIIINQVTANAHAIVILVLHQDVWNIVLGNMRHVQVIRRNFVASTMANPCCCNFIYRLETVGKHQCCNFLDLEFSSDSSWLTGMLIIFRTVSPLHIALQPKASSLDACLII